MDKLTLAELQNLLDYNPDTGEFTWLVNRGRMAPAGSKAGCLRMSGYVQIIVDGKTYSAHRLAWLFVNGKWPDQEIDHIDGVRSNNAIRNLRDVDMYTNRENRRVATYRSASGLIGVSPRANGKWLSQIQVRGRKMHIGTFDTAEAAHAAYVTAKRAMHVGNTL